MHIALRLQLALRLLPETLAAAGCSESVIHALAVALTNRDKRNLCSAYGNTYIRKRKLKVL